MGVPDLIRVETLGPDGTPVLTAATAAASLALSTAAAGIGFNGAAAAPPMAATNVDMGLKEVNAAVSAIVPGMPLADVRIGTVVIAQGAAAGEITYAGRIFGGGTAGPKAEAQYMTVTVLDNVGTVATVVASPTWTPSNAHVVVAPGARSIIQSIPGDGKFEGKIGGLTAGSEARLIVEVASHLWGTATLIAGTSYLSNGAVVKV